MQRQNLSNLRLVICAGAALWLCALAADLPKRAWAESEQPRASFNFRLPFVPGSDSTPYYVAATRYWPKMGLHGTVLPGRGSASAVQSTGAGTDQMAMVDFSAAVNGIRQGVPITIIAAPAARDTSGVIYTASSGIKDWNDLKGKRVGFVAGAVSVLETRAALQERGIDPQSVEWQTVPPGAQLGLLKAGTLKAATGYAGAQDIQLACGGTAAGSLRVYDAGIQDLGQMIIVNTDWAKKVGDAVVSDALLGAIEGYTVVKTNPKEAFQDLEKLAPDAQIDLVPELAAYDVNRGFMPWVTEPMDPSRGFAWIDATHVSAALAALERAGVLKAGGNSNASAYFTTKYLENPSVTAATHDWMKHKWAPLSNEVRQKCGL